MEDNKLPVPPNNVPKVDRVTGKITNDPRETAGGLDGWEASFDPFEGGVHAALNFNDECPADQRAKAIAEFNKRSSNSVI